MPKDDVVEPVSDGTGPDTGPILSPRPGRGLRIALIVSVALNLGVAGLVAGLFLHGPPMPPMAVRDLGFGPFGAALNDEDRAALRAAFVKRGPDLRTARRAMTEDVAAVSAALRAEPFAPDALRAALDRGAGRMVEFLTLGQALLFDHVVAMDPAARMALADRLDAMLARRGPQGKGPGHPPPLP